jgi:hypothetical protein
VWLTTAEAIAGHYLAHNYDDELARLRARSE